MLVAVPDTPKRGVGRVDDSSIREIWNSKVLLLMRKAFKRARLSRKCSDQLCQAVASIGKPHGEERPSVVVKVQRQEHA